MLFYSGSPLCPDTPLLFYLRSISAKVLPKRAGDGETLMPAASMAAILLSASPLPPEMMAPGRCGAAGNESHHRLLAAAFGFIGEELSRVLLRRASDLADHYNCLGGLVGQEHRQHIDELGALHRVAADADCRGLPQSRARGLKDRLIRERA